MISIPEPLRAGDRVAIVAPSSPFPRAALLAGLAWLAQRYALVVREDLFSRDGYLAGDDERRAEETARAMRDPSVRAIFVARGGYGATRVVSRLPWDEFARAPKWVVGFSDTTALHAFASAAGVASLHAPNVTGLGASSNARLAQNRGALLASLERPCDARSYGDLRVISKGDARGPLFGGNLALLHALAAANALDVPDGAIVMLEDVTERPYRVDRMLTSLLEGDHFARASAIVFGDFAECAPGPDGVTVERVIEERTARLGIPVYRGAPFGHGARNEAFTMGATATLARGVLSWSAP